MGALAPGSFFTQLTWYEQNSPLHRLYFHYNSFCFLLYFVLISQSKFCFVSEYFPLSLGKPLRKFVLNKTHNPLEGCWQVLLAGIVILALFDTKKICYKFQEINFGLLLNANQHISVMSAMRQYAGSYAAQNLQGRGS